MDSIETQQLTHEQKRAVEEFTREMQETVIPEIVEAVHQRHVAAVKSRRRIIRTL